MVGVWLGSPSAPVPARRFVLAAIERHFDGCRRTEVGHGDSACTDTQDRRWVIEAKSETSAVGT
jgi:hypothetical protein